MNAFRLCLLAGCILLIPGLALSQESGQVKLSDEAARQLQVGIKLSDEVTRQLVEGVRLTDPTRKQMYEDIEILRRILNEKLNLPRVFVDPLIQFRNLNQPQGGGLGGFSGGLSGMGGIGGGGILGNPGMQGGMPGMGTGGIGGLGGGGGMRGSMGMGAGFGATIDTNVFRPSPSSIDFPAAEGVYLKGYGVVFNLVLPHQPKAKPKETKPAVKPVSEWDRIRKEMHGEKVQPEAKPARPSELTLTERLLRILADNGHHFSQLGDKENITIVVTFREAPSAAMGGFQSIGMDVTDQGAGSLLFGVGINSDAGLTGSINEAGEGGTQPIQQQEGESSRAGGKGIGQPSEQKPGDNAAGVKSGQPASSAKDNILLGDLLMKQGNYDEAKEAYHIALKILSGDKDNPQTLNLLQKLAQVYVANGQYEEAKKLLDDIVKHKNVAAKNPKKETPKPTPLPSKLIITAPKALLDQVGSSRIDFEAFTKAVSVEYENFTAVENK
jgi:hypothetical protein